MSKYSNTFRESLSLALVDAWDAIMSRIGDESMYGFSVYTSGEKDFGYVCVSANTEEGLVKKARDYARAYDGYAGIGGRKRLRWSVPDWQYHDFDGRVSALKLPPGEGSDRDTAIYRDLVHGLKSVQRRPSAKAILPRVTFLITCGDMSDRWFLKGLRKLNSRDVVEQYINEYTAIPFRNDLESLAWEARRSKLLSLYRDLSLGVLSEQAVDVVSRNVNRYDLGDMIVELGPGIVGDLLDLVEEFGFGQLFNREGTPGYERDGVIHCETALATATVFLISSIGNVSDTEIRRMQALVERRVSCDRDLAMTFTLAENLARVLHQLRPKLFPDTIMNSSTNHLENPEPFFP